MKYILALDNGTQFHAGGLHLSPDLDRATIFDTIRDAKVERSKWDQPFEIWGIKRVLDTHFKGH